MILAFVAWFAVLALAELRTATRREDLNHPGSGSDQRLITNFGLAALILAIGAAFPLAMMGAALAGNQLSLGLSHRMPIPWLVVLAAALLAQTFVSYWIHRWMHRTTFLWRFHRVHHADSSVDVSTSLRNHPLELVLQMPASAMVIVALGAPATAVIAMQVVLLFNKVWEHADVSLPEKIERRLSRVIFTPALHRLHHSPERSLHDSNYGELFILWDYLFGTLKRRPGRGPVGLEAQVARPDRLIDQLCSPLYAL